MTQQGKMKPIERVKPKTGSFIMTSQGWVKVTRNGFDEGVCAYCTGGRTGLPGNACENCMNTGIASGPTEIDCKTCFGEGWYWNNLLGEERPCIDCDGLGSHPIGDTHDK